MTVIESNILVCRTTIHIYRQQNRTFFENNYFYELGLSGYRRHFRNRLGNRSEIYGRLVAPLSELDYGGFNDRQFSVSFDGSENSANRHGLRDLDGHRRGRHDNFGNDFFRRTARYFADFVHFIDRRRNCGLEINFGAMKFPVVSL